MKTVSEIFATNPDLLETKEVKELCEQFAYQMQQMRKREINVTNKVSDLIMRSEYFVKDGTPLLKTFEKITEIVF